MSRLENVTINSKLIGRAVRRLRKRATHPHALKSSDRRGLTQTTFAKRAGVSRGYLSDIERGARNVSVEVLVKLARALHVTPDCLLGFRVRAPRATS